MLWLFRKLFDDKRWTIALLLLWMVTVCTIFYFLGAFHMSYMHVGRQNMVNVPIQPVSHAKSASTPKHIPNTIFLPKARRKISHEAP